MRDKILPRSKGLLWRYRNSLFSQSQLQALWGNLCPSSPPSLSPPVLTPFLCLTFSLPDLKSSQQGVIIYKEAATQKRWKEAGLAATSCQNLPRVLMFAILADATTVHYHFSFFPTVTTKEMTLDLFCECIQTQKLSKPKWIIFIFSHTVMSVACFTA